MTATSPADELSEGFIPTRRTLVGRLKNWEDRESWQEFFDTYWRLIYRLARKAGLGESEAQDVVQETVLAAAKAMPGYEYDPQRCSFKGWLLYLTRCRIADQLRKAGRQVRTVSSGTAGTARTALLERVADPAAFAPETEWEEEWEQNLFEAALQQVKERVDAKQFQMFYYAAVKQWPAGEVARTLEVSAARVYLAKHRVAAQVKKELVRLKAKWQ
jgi:RNA polymerase sigma factor (sigma-70 family)